MKILKSPQKVLILFLTVLVIISFIMILRLEGKTAILQSRLDEHHKSLEKNKDVLDNLDSFSRMIKNNGISIDGNKVILQSGQSNITLQNNNLDVSSNGDIAIGSPTKTFVYIQKDGNIIIGPDNAKNLGYKKNEDFIYMKYNKSRIALGQFNTNAGKTEGISLISETSGPMLAVTRKGILFNIPNKNGDYSLRMLPKKDLIEISKGESIIKLEDKNVNIESKGDISFIIDQDKEFGYSAKRDFIHLSHNKAHITVGTQTSYKGKNHIGVSIISPNKNTMTISDEGFLAGVPGKTGPEEDYRITIAKDKFVQLRKGKSKITMEGDDIKIEALGDINITSKNGNVNINGKKVSLNE